MFKKIDDNLKGWFRLGLIVAYVGFMCGVIVGIAIKCYEFGKGIFV